MSTSCGRRLATVLIKTSGCEIAQAVSAACPARLLLIVVVG
jgi:hypothetical protein